MNEIELQKTREAVRAELDKLDPRADAAQDAPPVRYGGYHEAASVLSVFDVEKLNPADPAGEESVVDLLVNCTLVYDERHRSHWTLLPEVRRDVLRQLGTRKAMLNVLAANPARHEDGLQAMLESCLRGASPDIDRLSLDELVGLHQVLDWLPEGAASGLPDKRAVAQRLERLRLLQPFQKLVGGHFRGRGGQLQRLHDYVEVLPPGSRYESVRRDARKFLSLHERPPLLIHAAGGMGKSTLVAKFILDHATLAPEDRFPFVYIDFDRPGLVAEEPLTLLIEAVRQLGMQYPEARDSCEKIVESWHASLTSALRRQSRQGTKARSRMARVSASSLSDRSDYLRTFKDLLKTLKVSKLPLLLVLDTFEEVQYRSQAYIRELWRFLEELQRAVPRLRTVLSGRSRIGDFKTEELELPLLDLAACQGFLEDRGVRPPEVAAAVARQVGGDPLSLKLAAQVFGLEGANEEGIRDLQTREVRFGILSRRLDQGRIQGQLYERILNHIHTDEVKALAHPGLILRRVTPEIILKVLAAPCGVPVNDLAQAQQLFEELRREVSLVVPAEDGSLRHRPDVRRVMIKLLLASDEKEKIDSIQHSAVAYYEQQEGVIARAEEIYHRLSLKQDHSIIDGRWIEGVQPYLYNAVEELGPAEQAYLASRLGIELDEEVWKEAALEDWERRTAHNLEELIQVGDFEKALALLGERSERTLGSTLFLLEGLIYEGMHRWPDAERVAARGIESVSQTGEVDQLFDLLMLRARANYALANYEDARMSLAKAGELARQLGNKVNMLRVHLEMSRLARVTEDAESSERARQEVSDILKGMTDAELSEQLGLLRGLAAVWGKDDAALLSRSIRLVGIDTAGPSQRRALARAIVAWERELSSAEQAEPGLLARAVNLEQSGGLTETWAAFLNNAPATQIAETLAHVLKKFDVSDSVRDALLDILRQPVVPEGAASKGETAQSHKAATARAANLNLTGAQITQLADALLSAFPTYQFLEMMVVSRLGRNLDAISLGESIRQKVYDLLHVAQVEGWVANLIVAARESNPENPALQKVAEQFGLAASSPQLEVLERIVHKSSGFTDPARWRAKLGALEGRVCRVEVNASAWWGASYGTGFLVGPDLILTTYHLVENVADGKTAPDKVAFRFDYKRTAAGEDVNPGTLFTLHPQEWLVDYSLYAEPGAGELRSSDPSLDYALLRLAASPGNEPIGANNADPNAPPRGWVRIPPHPSIAEPNSPLYILQHPEGGPLQVAANPEGVIGISPDGMRLRYRTETLPGSTGAPCFDVNWDLMAIHQRKLTGTANDPGYNEGTLVSAVVELLRARGKDVLLTELEPLP